MAIETLSVPLSGNNINLQVDNIISGNKQDNQIITFSDNGAITGNMFISKSGHGTPTEGGAGEGGDDEFHFDLSQFNDDFSITVKSLNATDVFYVNGWNTHTVSGTTHTFTYTGTDGQSHQLVINPVSNNGTGTATVVCFARGTLIGTPDGPVPVEQLVIDDIIQCGDGLARPIRWIGSRRLGGEELQHNPQLRPVLIRENAFGDGAPWRDLLLSQQHRIVLDGALPELLFGEDRVLAAATYLENDHSVLRQHQCREIEYFHILVDGHQTLFANGLEAETLFLGDGANEALGAEARSEIFSIFPELQTDVSLSGPTCLFTLNRTEATALTGCASPRHA